MVQYQDVTDTPRNSDAHETVLRKIYTDEQIYNMLNTISKNDNQSTGLTTSKKGGQTKQKYKVGDEVDEATMKELKKLGFTFEKI